MNMIAILLLFLIQMISCSGAAFAATPIKVAAIFSMSGIASSHNDPLVSMVQLAASELNQNGGVIGRPLKLMLLDNQSTTIGSTRAAEKACELGVAAVIGAHWSSHSLAIAPILQRHGIPMITPASTHPAVTQVGDFIFRVCFVDSSQGFAMARFAHEKLGVRKAAVLRNLDETYCMALADYFRRALVQAGGEVILDMGYRGKAVDFSDIIEQLRALRPDAVYLPGYTRDSGLLIKQAVSKGLKTIFLGGDAWDEIYAVAGHSLEGSYQSAPWHPNVPFPMSLHLQEIHANKFGDRIANMSAPLAYDALKLLADAITRAGSADRTKIRDALATTVDFKGATGYIGFDQDRNPKHKDIIILRYDKAGPQYFTTLRY
jgi:branched-chain amino acid transport system substrate-binding protein